MEKQTHRLNQMNKELQYKELYGYQRGTVTGIIYIDGPDCTGKTTLANYFVEKYGALYIHGEGRWFGNMHAYHTALLRRAVQAAGTRLVVIDRLWMSEICYADIYRGGTEWEYSARLLDRILLGSGGISIITIPSDGSVGAPVRRHMELSESRDEMYEPDERIGLVVQEYIDLAFGCQPRDPKFEDYGTVTNKYTYTIDNIGGLINRPDTLVYDIDQWIDQVERFGELAIETLIRNQVASDSKYVPYGPFSVTGCRWGARYLIVGDLSDVEFRNPGFRFNGYGGSNLAFTKMLQDLQIDETELLWYHLDEDQFAPVELMELISETDLIPVAIGPQTYTKCRRLNKDSKEIWHPNFLTGYTTLREKQRYEDQLKEALDFAE